MARNVYVQREAQFNRIARTPLDQLRARLNPTYLNCGIPSCVFAFPRYSQFQRSKSSLDEPLKLSQRDTRNRRVHCTPLRNDSPARTRVTRHKVLNVDAGAIQRRAAGNFIEANNLKSRGSVPCLPPFARFYSTPRDCVRFFFFFFFSRAAYQYTRSRVDDKRRD